MSVTQKRRSRAVITLGAVFASLFLATGPSRAVDRLNIATATNATLYGPVWVALAEKLFEKRGLDVNLVSTTALSTGPALLVSGNADLVVTTAFLGLRIATEGKPLRFLMTTSDMGTRINAFVGRPNLKSIKDLADKGDACRVIVATVGTGSWAIWLGLAKKYDLKCAVSNSGSGPAILASALSGQFDAGVVNPQEAYTARDAGKASILLDPLTISDEEASEIYPHRHPLSVVVGMGPNLEAKRDVVVRFLAALREAGDRIAASSPEQLSALSRVLPQVFGSMTPSALALQWQVQAKLSPHGPEAGVISREEWKNLLDAAPLLWGFANLRPDEPTLQYDKVVDMSYFEAARGK